MASSVGGMRPTDSNNLHVLDWSERNLFVIPWLHTWLHIAEHISDEDDFFVSAVKAMTEEEWNERVHARCDIKTMTLHQRARANRGVLTKMDGQATSVEVHWVPQLL